MRSFPGTQDALIEADGNRRPRIIRNSPPFVTFALIGVTTIVFLIQIIAEARSGTDVALESGAKYGPLVYFGEYWRLITPVFLHGGLQHFLSNMYSLYILGPNVETFWGKRDYLIYYLIAGFTGNVFSYVFSFYTVSVGASTAIFGLLIASAFVFLKNKAFFPNYRNTLYRIGSVIAINFLIGMSARIDNWGHLGGFAGGLIICLFAAPLFAPAYDPDRDRTVLTDKISTPRRFLAFAAVMLLSILGVIIFNNSFAG